MADPLRIIQPWGSVELLLISAFSTRHSVESGLIIDRVLRPHLPIAALVPA